MQVYASDSQGDNAPLEVVCDLVSVLRGERAGLVTDVDGTISPMVPRREEALVLPAARRALEGLRDVLSLVAVVSGRSAADARAMVGVAGLTYIGNHGLEVWTDAGPQLVAEARPWVAVVAAVLDDLQRKLSRAGSRLDTSGILLENKGATASIHYRLAPDPDAAQCGLLEMLAGASATSGLWIEEGRMVINLLPPLGVTKGSAVTRLASEHQLNRLVYVGDDVTDVHAFNALRALRQTGQVHTLSIGVVGRESAPSVRQGADACVASVTAVGDLLQQTLEQLRRAPPAAYEGRGEC